MRLPPLSVGAGASLADFEGLAHDLAAAHRNGDPLALEGVRAFHPRHRDPSHPWLAREVPLATIAAEPLTPGDARLVVARFHDYLDWEALAMHVEAASDPTSPVGRFERAAEHVVNGEVGALEDALGAEPTLVSARSTRRTCLDPAVHGATLLHYVAANGVENHRQRTPPNAVAIARTLLAAGADPDALAQMYGGDAPVLSMLVSSSHPRSAGLAVALVELLLDHGASPDPTGDGSWVSPLHSALVFGYRDVAEALHRRGAAADTLPTAAGLGRQAWCAAHLPGADHGERRAALAMAVMNGQVDVARLLLEAGVDPAAYHPEGYHGHATPLHQAALAGDLTLCELLLSFGADPAARDTIHDATPLGWAEHAGQAAVADRLRPVTPAV